RRGGNIVKVVLYDHNRIVVNAPSFDSDFLISSSEAINAISSADLKNNGNNYILFVDGNNVEAANLQGASADNFPFTDPLGIGFTGTPLAADFEGDGKAEVIAYTKDG